ncbi:MAG: hypothetical protein ACRCXT_00520 [Paraclostridium sp.]
MALNTLLANTASVVYTCSYGNPANASPTSMTIRDMISARKYLEKNKVKRVQNMYRPSQLGVGGIGNTYAMLCSVDSKAQIEMTLADTPQAVVRPEQMQIIGYKNHYLYTVVPASLSIVYSTEYQSNGSSSVYRDFLIGGNSMFMGSQAAGGMKSRISIRPALLYPYGRHSAVDLLSCFAFAMVSNRIVETHSAPYSKA